MEKSTLNLEQYGVIVYETLSLIMAVIVCDQLQGAGFPAWKEKADSGFAVLVPGEYAFQSCWLLSACSEPA